MMDRTQFRKKYLGEVTLRNGEHVKFLFPVTEQEIARLQTAAETVWKRMHWKRNPDIRGYEWCLMDDLNLSQFRIVFTAIKQYGNNYWNFLWRERNKRNQTMS